jgi:predicted esterase
VRFGAERARVGLCPSGLLRGRSITFAPLPRRGFATCGCRFGGSASMRFAEGRAFHFVEGFAVPLASWRICQRQIINYKKNNMKILTFASIFLLLFSINRLSAQQKTTTTTPAKTTKTTPAKKSSSSKSSTSKKTSSRSGNYTRSGYPIPDNPNVVAVKKSNLPYEFLVYTPEDYKKDTTRRYPMILFLHGRSLSGKNIEMVKRYGIIYEILRGQKMDFVVIAPQCQAGWNSNKLIEVLDYAQKTYRVDTCRTYLTGMSMGGYGAWILAGDYPKRFAAVAPVCGGGYTKHASSLVNMPTWVFHGALDKAVPISESQKMVDAIKAKKGKVIKFTIYKNDGHSELVKVFRMKELYQWFMKHELP